MLLTGQSEESKYFKFVVKETSELTYESTMTDK